MRYLGVDYGTKKVGIAISSESNSLAFPRAVIPNNDNLLPEIVKMCIDESVTNIVMGESLNFKGVENKVMPEARAFAKELAEATRCEMHFEPEHMTSEHARKLSGDHAMIDASAAALILQTFLDKKNKRSVMENTETNEEKKEEVVEEKKDDIIKIDDVAKLKIRFGKIVSAEKVENADKLLKLMIDVGESEPRQILSGIAPHYPEPAELVGCMVPVIINLAPRTIRGLESNGMVLYAVGKDTLYTVEPTGDIESGTPLK